MGIFWENFTRNQLILHWFHECVQCFLTEIVTAILSTKCLKNEPRAKLLTSWLVPSFSQHNLCLVVLGCCSLIAVSCAAPRPRKISETLNRWSFQMLLLNSYWASRLSIVRGVKEKKWHWDSKIHFFCVVPLSLRAKYEFWYFEAGLFANCTSPIMYLKLHPKVCITFVFRFSWVYYCLPKRNWKPCWCKILGGK